MRWSLQLETEPTVWRVLLPGSLNYDLWRWNDGSEIVLEMVICVAVSIVSSRVAVINCYLLWRYVWKSSRTRVCVCVCVHACVCVCGSLNVFACNRERRPGSFFCREFLDWSTLLCDSVSSLYGQATRHKTEELLFDSWQGQEAFFPKSTRPTSLYPATS